MNKLYKHYVQYMLFLLELSRTAFSGCVYFIQCANKIKIGQTRHLCARIKAIQTMCPEPVLLIQYIKTKNPPKLEKAFHKQFSYCHYRGEWFRMNKRDLRQKN